VYGHLQSVDAYAYGCVCMRMLILHVRPRPIPSCDEAAAFEKARMTFDRACARGLFVLTKLTSSTVLFPAARVVGYSRDGPFWRVAGGVGGLSDARCLGGEEAVAGGKGGGVNYVCMYYVSKYAAGLCFV